MDIFAHVLWTNVAFKKKYRFDRKQRYIAALFGVLPDLVAFTPIFVYALFSGRKLGPAGFEGSGWIYQWAPHVYQYSHSLVIFALAVIIVTTIRRGKIYWPMFGWMLHILIDIPSHKGFYETPFLFPLSNYHFHHGLSWADPTYMIVNYSALAVVYLFIFLYYDRKEKAKQ